MSSQFDIKLLVSYASTHSLYLQLCPAPAFLPQHASKFLLIHGACTVWLEWQVNISRQLCFTKSLNRSTVHFSNTPCWSTRHGLLMLIHWQFWNWGEDYMFWTVVAFQIKSDSSKIHSEYITSGNAVRLVRDFIRKVSGTHWDWIPAGCECILYSLALLWGGKNPSNKVIGHLIIHLPLFALLHLPVLHIEI